MRGDTPVAEQPGYFLEVIITCLLKANWSVDILATCRPICGISSKKCWSASRILGDREAGPPYLIFSHLRNPSASALLIELIHAELHYRLGAGEAVRVEIYFEQYPELRGDSKIAIDVILTEFSLRQDREPDLSPDEYLARFPELAGQLESKLGTIITPVNPPGSSSKPSADAVGLDLREYELLDRVGGGGMGEVFRCQDPGAGPRPGGQGASERAVRQRGSRVSFGARGARITGALQHPNIVPVHNLGRLPDGRLYFTMKLVRGRTLAEILSDGREEKRLPELLGHFEKICQAVAFAHSRGVIHRDLKPLNVMVGAFGEIQVMDWGLAKVLQSTTDVESRAFDSGERGDTVRRIFQTSSTMDDYRTGIVGTPAYMSLEQARCNGGDRRTGGRFRPGRHPLRNPDGRTAIFRHWYRRRPEQRDCRQHDGSPCSPEHLRRRQGIDGIMPGVPGNRTAQEAAQWEGGGGAGVGVSGWSARAAS